MKPKETMTRRRFLEVSAIAGGTVITGDAALAVVLKSTTDTSSEPERTVEPPLRVRPVVVKRDDETVAIVQQFPPPPLAYFDKEAAKLYVDSEHRYDVQSLLNAVIYRSGIWSFYATDQQTHIQVLEETLDNWDKTKMPHIGDMRVINRSYKTVRLDFNHLPVFDSDSPIWVNGESIGHGQRVGTERLLGREDYQVIGSCNQFADAECIQPVGKAKVLNWVALSTI